MRLKNILNLLAIKRYMILRRDFISPLKAMLAVAGILKKPFDLATKDGHSMIIFREDQSIWEAYFRPDGCVIEIQEGMFRVTPADKNYPTYLIAPGGQAVTHNPQRWNSASLQIPLIKTLQNAERKVFSQHGEDGVLDYLFDHIPVKSNYIVELGAHDGLNMSNSRYFIEQKGWFAFLVEADKRFYKQLSEVYRTNPRVKALKSYITPENINQLFLDAKVPSEFDILSIDIDSTDYNVWEELTVCTPSIVIVEYNASYGPEVEYIVSREDAVRLAGAGGASLLAYEKLARRKGYQLIYTELSGANAFFIHDSCKQYFPGVDWGLLDAENLYQPPQFGMLTGGIAVNGRGYVS